MRGNDLHDGMPWSEVMHENHTPQDAAHPVPCTGSAFQQDPALHRSLYLEKKNGKSSIPTIILYEFLEAFHTPDRET